MLPLRLHILAIVLVSICGCGDGSSANLPGNPGPSKRGTYAYVEDYRTIRFSDDAESNVDPVDRIADLTFTTTDGVAQRVRELAGQKNIVLVVTRGFAGQVCVYCSTQTSMYVNNYARIAERDAEVIVVYPLEEMDGQGTLERFIKSVRAKLEDERHKSEPIPFPLVLDPALKGVNELGIRADLAKPSTYILDKQGRVRFAYVGQKDSDRPSISAVLRQLDKLKAAEPPAQP